MYVNNCDGNEAFNDDSTCLDENPLNDQICVSTQADLTGDNSLWNGDRTFQVFDELCMNDKPVYHYVQLSNSTFVEYDDNYTILEVDETSFYVHYELFEIDVNGTESIGMWMLTQDEISTNYIAFCESEDLEECTESNWHVQTLFVSHGNKTDITTGDGYIDDVIDEFMTITNGHCDSRLSDENEMDNNDTKNEGKATMIVLIVVCVLMLLMLICAAPFCVRKWLECHGNGKKEAVSDMEEDPEPDQEQTLEVEVEVNLSKDTNSNGEAITMTQV